MTEIEKRNRSLYLQCPTQEQIDSFIKECKASDYGFESFFGLPYGTIKVVRNGYMALPLKYWHIFYERIIPTYGAGASVNRNPLPVMLKKIQKKKKHVAHQISSDDRLAAFR